MIRPDKHTNIKYSIVFLAAVMMKEILENGIIKYDDLKNRMMYSVGEDVSDNFEYTLSYLYILGKVEYVHSLDSIKGVDV